MELRDIHTRWLLHSIPVGTASTYLDLEGTEEPQSALLMRATDE